MTVVDICSDISFGDIYSHQYRICGKYFRWKFAYNCILEETVRRRRKMWSWENIKYHRDLCKQYKATYKKKLTTKKVTVDQQKVLDVSGCFHFTS